MKLLNTHGSKTECGLTELDIFDTRGERITLIQNIKVMNSPLANQHQILRLCDGYTYTTDDKHMWFCHLPTNTDEQIILEMKFLASDKIGGIRIWNYNKSLIDSKIGYAMLIKLDFVKWRLNWTD